MIREDTLSMKLYNKLFYKCTFDQKIEVIHQINARRRKNARTIPKDKMSNM